MFTWEAVQAALGGPVPAAGQGYADYWADLAGVVTRLLARDIAVILSPWQFNTASGDTDIVYDDAAFTAADFGDFWGKFAAAVNGVTGGDLRVSFDLINEPHTHAEAGNKAGDIGISLADLVRLCPGCDRCDSRRRRDEHHLCAGHGLYGSRLIHQATAAQPRGWG